MCAKGRFVRSCAALYGTGVGAGEGGGVSTSPKWTNSTFFFGSTVGTVGDSPVQETNMPQARRTAATNNMHRIMVLLSCGLQVVRGRNDRVLFCTIHFCPIWSSPPVDILFGE